MHIYVYKRVYKFHLQHVSIYLRFVAFTQETRIKIILRVPLNVINFPFICFPL